MLPVLSAISAEKAPLLTVAVFNDSPESTTPSLSASLKIVTVAPVSPEPEIVNALVPEVMLSEVDDPVSSAVARSKLVGAEALVSTVIESADEAELALPAVSV